MESTFLTILIQAGMNESGARQHAALFMQNSLEGVYTHGVNRFPRFVEYIKRGDVKLGNAPIPVNRIGGLEQWDGQCGPGPGNAFVATSRAMELASQNGIGCVALSNTNHWMRGGTYGWHAASKGYVFIGWTNTIANMPAWGALDAKLGNNPLVMAVPFGDSAIVLDMAMSQYSFGSLEQSAMQNKTLPVPGGYDVDGSLSMDPKSILKSSRVLPIGFWKGAGLSFLLDILATILSGGLAVHQISSKKTEANLSQVFVCFDLTKLHNHSSIQATLSAIVNDYTSSIPVGKNKVVYPGERVVQTRAQNEREGIPVSATIWKSILSLIEG